MTENTDSYSTMAGSLTATKPIVEAIKKVVSMDNLDTKPESGLGVEPINGIHPLFITGTYPTEPEIPRFVHPISISGIRGKNVICTDLRSVLRKPDEGRTFGGRISDMVNFNFLVARTVLDMYWVAGRDQEFLSSFSFAAKVFGNWMGQVLRSCGVNPEDQAICNVVAMAYYYDLCTQSQKDVDEEVRLSVITHWGIMNSERVKSILEKIKKTSSLDGLIENFRTTTGSLYLQRFNATLLLQSIQNHWRGAHREQVMAVATQHPPTWVALVWHVLVSKTFKGCMLESVASKSGNRGEGDLFLREFTNLFHFTHDRVIRMETEHLSSDDYGLTTDYDPEQLILQAASNAEAEQDAITDHMTQE